MDISGFRSLIDIRLRCLVDSGYFRIEFFRTGMVDVSGLRFLGLG